MGRSIFITATDTNAGKTRVTAGLVRAMLQDGVSARALKPVACGMDAAGRNADIDALLKAQRLQHMDEINLYRFQPSAAPSQAAAAGGLSINPDQLIAWCAEQAAKADVCLIEGVGGLMAPLSDDYLVCDWIEAMPEAEVWLVVACRLGAINHALLSLDKLKRLDRSPARILLNAVTPSDDCWLEPTRQAIAPFLSGASHACVLTHGSEVRPHLWRT